MFTWRTLILYIITFFGCCELINLVVLGLLNLKTEDQSPISIECKSSFGPESPLQDQQQLSEGFIKDRLNS